MRRRERRALRRTVLWTTVILPSRSTLEVAADIFCSASMAASALLSW